MHNVQPSAGSSASAVFPSSASSSAAAAAAAAAVGHSRRVVFGNTPQPSAVMPVGVVPSSVPVRQQNPVCGRCINCLNLIWLNVVALECSRRCFADFER